jgi:Uma2 family endonuclease
MAAQTMLATVEEAAESETPPINGQWEVPPLPTFDWDMGWKYVLDPETGEYEPAKLTLADILYPSGEEIKMPESPQHEFLARLLRTMLYDYLTALGWLVFGDVFIYWPNTRLPPAAPDVAVIPAPIPIDSLGASYRAGQSGPLPAFVLEITSKGNRSKDLKKGPEYYAAVGVRELLVIDMKPDTDQPWHLHGYRLGDSPIYQKIEPDAESGLTFETVGLRFLAVERQRVEVYVAATRERLLTPDERIARAEARAQAEARRAASEQERADLAERLNQSLQAQIQLLQAQLKQLPENPAE